MNRYYYIRVLVRPKRQDLTISQLQSQPRVVGTLELDHVIPHPPPPPLINVGKYRGKNHSIINIVSGGRGELAWCPNYFVWDCRLLLLFVSDTLDEQGRFAGLMIVMPFHCCMKRLKSSMSLPIQLDVKMNTLVYWNF